MKVSTLVSAALAAAAVDAHSIFQKVSVNGADQGQLKGVRAPDSDYPLYSVSDANLACNTGITHKDSTIINIPAGAKVGAWWGHVIGGAQGSNDADNPIAASHKGPIMVYLAKVDDASSTGTSGLKWFKVAEDGLDGNQWAVDKMIANGGYHYFTMPSCVAPGNYLMRVELIALHSASTAGGAQFYMECAQINIQGSGTNTGGSTVSIPGVYPANDPGIVINIYDSKGSPYMGGKSYPIPGPRPITCDGSTSSSSTGSTGSSSGSTSSSGSSSGSGSSSSSSGGAALWAQCGGTGFSGPTTCAQGTCTVINSYYSQCTQ